ncbi:thioesterase II family protein [Ruminococcus flavefaciens]|uniref:thioesterase II family protein n=1 Tax=Ruminococcus flavefaciens TaxID=1265 RepID=UPI0026F3382C|nr:alpha/beta fold hydrolase [Ruminococcus flavefaciens]
MSKVKVFCLPYAGGSKSIFNDWIDEYKDNAEIIPVEYSGHSSRFGEELFTDANDMAEDVFSTIIAEKPVNYIIYGHSMGCLISLLTALKLEERYAYPPKKVIIGGTRPPHLSGKDEKISGLPKKEFMDKFFEMDMMDPEIMDEPELLDLLYEVFYADTLVGESYKGYTGLPKLKAPMIVMTGSQDDEACEADMREWEKYTYGHFEFKEFDAGHFFPFNCSEFHDYFAGLIAD